jgi:DNA-binding response OmpR family regulator
MKILIIEDEKELSKSISTYLSGENFFCEQAYDFPTALEKISIHEYACIILDIMLPGGTGLDLITVLQRDAKMDGVLIISAKNSLDDKVLALKAGADDYLTKPFHLSELAARVAAIIRRKSFNGRNLIHFGDLAIDLNEKTAHVGPAQLDLTRKEFELLLYFISNKNRVIGKEAIATHLWGDDMDISGSYDFIYTHIKNLRKKLVGAGSADPIKSIYGMGYKFSIS